MSLLGVRITLNVDTIYLTFYLNFFEHSVTNTLTLLGVYVLVIINFHNNYFPPFLKLPSIYKLSHSFSLSTNIDM